MRKNSVISLIVSIAFMLSLSGCGTSSAISALQNALDPTTATDKLITVRISMEGESDEYDGLYTGELKDGLPNGEGAFMRDTDAGSLTYKGFFSNGKITGDGVLTLKTVDEGKLKYEGRFVDGALEGYGVTTLTFDGETLSRRGTYTNGVYTPSKGETFDYLGQMNLYGIFTLPNNVITYIDSHSELFPAENESTVESAGIQEFEYRQFTKTRKQETIGLVKLELYAAQVYEDEFEDLDYPVTYLLAIDKNENLYTLYYIGSEDIYDGDEFTAYVIPISTASFDNLGGGTTNVIVLAGSYIVVH